jgi:hypothetical protein
MKSLPAAFNSAECRAHPSARSFTRGGECKHGEETSRILYFILQKFFASFFQKRREIPAPI